MCAFQHSQDSTGIVQLFDTEYNNDMNFGPSQVKYETITCNLCQGKDHKIISKKDRHGFRQQSVICTSCGLIFLNPRMVKDDYDLFYKTDYYRRIVKEYITLHHKSASWRLPNTEQESFDSARSFGLALILRVKKHLQSGLCIEVGSSSGGILAAIRETTGNPVMGIEPSMSECAFAEKLGIPTAQCLFENYVSTKSSAANIFGVQSMNHFLDPKKFFLWAHENLRDDGSLIVVVQNFLTMMEKTRSVRYATQIDHTYMFTPTSLQNFVRSAGFDIILFENWKDKKIKKAGLTTHHMLIVAKKNMHTPFSINSIDPKSFSNDYDLIKRYMLSGFVRAPIKFIKKIYRQITR